MCMWWAQGQKDEHSALSILSKCSTTLYPLARNQYINNSPGIFSCIRPGVNTCAACICTEINSPEIFLCIGTRDVRIHALYQYRGQSQSANTYFKNNSSKIFSCIRTSANTGPTCIRAKINSSRIFSCMYRFCAGGIHTKLKLLERRIHELRPLNPRAPPLKLVIFVMGLPNSLHLII